MDRIQPTRGPRLMNVVRDGIILGAVESIRYDCGVCKWPTRCISITAVTMPKGVEADWTIIAQRDDAGNPTGIIKFIGIGCGCYANFHRQVAHIRDGRKESITT